MWLDETTSPSTLSSVWDVVSRSAASARSISASPWALWPKRKFSPTDYVRGLEGLDEHVLDEVLRAARRELAVKGDDHQLGRRRARR